MAPSTCPRFSRVVQCNAASPITLHLCALALLRFGMDLRAGICRQVYVYCRLYQSVTTGLSTEQGYSRGCWAVLEPQHENDSRFPAGRHRYLILFFYLFIKTCTSGESGGPAAYHTQASYQYDMISMPYASYDS